MSLEDLRKEIESAIQEEGIEVTELIGEAIDNLFDVIDEEEDRKELDVDEYAEED